MSLAVSATVYSSLSYRPNSGTIVRTDGPYTLGCRFTVNRNIRLRGITLGQTLPAGYHTTNDYAIWNAYNHSIVAQGTVGRDSQGLLSSPVQLAPGVDYKIGIFVPDTENWIESAGVNPNPDFNIIQPVFKGPFDGLAEPDQFGSGPQLSAFTDFAFLYGTPSVETRTLLPEPEIIVDSRQFTIQIPSDWIPKDALEWDLQFARSSDNSSFGAWNDVATIPISVSSFDLDASGELDPAGIYTHVAPDLNPPLPYYVYRYKIRTNTAETDWSEPGYAGQVRDVVNEIDSGLVKAAPTDPTPGSGTWPSVVPTFNVTGILTAGNIVSNSDIAAVGTVSGSDGFFTQLTANQFTGSNVTITGNLIATTANITTATIANLISTGTATFGDLNASGLINGNKITQNSFNGVIMQDGELDGRYIKGQTITGDKVIAGFLDANVSAQAYIDAGVIHGGELALGGTRTFSDFSSNAGDLVWPWELKGTVVETAPYYAFYPKQAPTTVPTAPNRKYNVVWGQDFTCTLLQGSAISSGENLKLQNNRSSTNNSIDSMTFSLSYNLPTGMRIQLWDPNGAARPLSTPVTWTGSGSVTYTLDMTGETRPSGIAIALQCTNSVTVPSSGGPFFFTVDSVSFVYTRGYGQMSVYDSLNRLRAEVTANFIRFNKPSGVGGTETVFQVDSSGTWMAQDSLTVGSNKITGLQYAPRDLTGPLIINPRFEEINVTNQNKREPANWAYHYGTTLAGAVLNDTYCASHDGVYPQWQSTVSGSVLRMTLKSGWGTGNVVRAYSHKREVRPDAANGIPKIPLSFSGYFRTEQINQAALTATMYLYASDDAGDIVVTPTADTLLGSVSLTGAAITQNASSNEPLFQQLAKAFQDDPVNMKADTVKYVYVVLEAKVTTGTLGADTYIEWDNINLAMAERITSSDSQQEADLGRRITELQTLQQYLFSGTKAILPDLDGPNAGNQGLVMSVIY